MGEFLRKYVSRRLSVLSEGEICSPQRSNAPTWGSLSRWGRSFRHFPPAHLRWVGVRNSCHAVGLNQSGRQDCFGRYEWSAVRKAAISLLPKTSTIPSSVFLALGMVAAEPACALPPNKPRALSLGSVRIQWKSSGLKLNKMTRCSGFNTFNFVIQKNIGADDPPRAPQDNGGLADQWYLDDGDILCRPVTVLSFLQAFDRANVSTGAERTPHWTADGRPHPAVIRTLQCAADIASSRNGQQMSAKSLQYSWTHEFQIALFRRRAAMTRANLPDPFARAEWLLAGLTDTALSHYVRAPPLDGGGDDDDADTGTDTTTPDDDSEDIASHTSQQSAQPQFSNF